MPKTVPGSLRLARHGPFPLHMTPVSELREFITCQIDPGHDEAMASEESSTGHCGCGGVSYRTDATLRPVMNCHCERCRRITGHFMAATGCELAELEIDDDGSLRWYEPTPGVFYGFCSTCGSTLFWRTDDRGEWISIAAGTVDQPSGITTSAAWWTAEAADYHRLDPELTNHEFESGESGRQVGA